MVELIKVVTHQMQEYPTHQVFLLIKNWWVVVLVQLLLILYYKIVMLV